MRLTGSKAERIASVVFGTLLLAVQVPQIPKLPLPVNGQAVGYDAMWVLITGAGIWLLLYGVGVVRRKSNVSEL